MKTCPNCGVLNPDKALRCASCGTRLGLPGRSTEPAAPNATQMGVGRSWLGGDAGDGGGGAGGDAPPHRGTLMRLPRIEFDEAVEAPRRPSRNATMMGLPSIPERQPVDPNMPESGEYTPPPPDSGVWPQRSVPNLRRRGDAPTHGRTAESARPFSPNATEMGRPSNDRAMPRARQTLFGIGAIGAEDEHTDSGSTQALPRPGGPLRTRSGSTQPIPRSGAVRRLPRPGDAGPPSRVHGLRPRVDEPPPARRTQFSFPANADENPGPSAPVQGVGVPNFNADAPAPSPRNTATGLRWRDDSGGGMRRNTTAPIPTLKPRGTAPSRPSAQELGRTFAGMPLADDPEATAQNLFKLPGRDTLNRRAPAPRQTLMGMRALEEKGKNPDPDSTAEFQFSPEGYRFHGAALKGGEPEPPRTASTSTPALQRRRRPAAADNPMSATIMGIPGQSLEALNAAAPEPAPASAEGEGLNDALASALEDVLAQPFEIQESGLHTALESSSNAPGGTDSIPGASISQEYVSVPRKADSSNELPSIDPSRVPLSGIVRARRDPSSSTLRARRSIEPVQPVSPQPPAEPEQPAKAPDPPKRRPSSSELMARLKASIRQRSSSQEESTDATLADVPRDSVLSALGIGGDSASTAPAPSAPPVRAADSAEVQALSSDSGALWAELGDFESGLDGGSDFDLGLDLGLDLDSIATTTEAEDSPSLAMAETEQLPRDLDILRKADPPPTAPPKAEPEIDLIDEAGTTFDIDVADLQDTPLFQVDDELGLAATAAIDVGRAEFQRAAEEARAQGRSPEVRSTLIPLGEAPAPQEEPPSEPVPAPEATPLRPADTPTPLSQAPPQSSAPDVAARPSALTPAPSSAPVSASKDVATPMHGIPTDAFPAQSAPTALAGLPTESFPAQSAAAAAAALGVAAVAKPELPSASWTRGLLVAGGACIILSQLIPAETGWLLTRLTGGVMIDQLSAVFTLLVGAFALLVGAMDVPRRAGAVVLGGVGLAYLLLMSVVGVPGSALFDSIARRLLLMLALLLPVGLFWRARFPETSGSKLLVGVGMVMVLINYALPTTAFGGESALIVLGLFKAPAVMMALGLVPLVLTLGSATAFLNSPRSGLGMVWLGALLVWLLVTPALVSAGGLAGGLALGLALAGGVAVATAGLGDLLGQLTHPASQD